MYKQFMVVLMFGLLPTISNASKIACPATVKAGTALKISATITNDDCSGGLTISKTIVSLIGNSGTGSIGLQGPFVKPFANNFNTLIPQAKCSNVLYTPGHPEYGSYPVTKSTSHTFSNLLVVNPVPANLAGTLVAVTAGVLDTDNQIIMAGICNISVTK